MRKITKGCAAIFLKKSFPTKLLLQKKNIYKEYFIFVKNAIEDNEEIIVKLDALLLEISKHSTIEAGENRKHERN